VFKKRSQVCMQVDEFHGGTLSHFTDFIRRNGRSVFSEEDSRHPVSHQISQRSRGDTSRVFQRVLSSGGAG
jgi:hypothetical protein